MAVLLLLGLVSVANGLLLLAVLASLVRGDEKSGGQLLLKAITVWGTNVIAFGLWYWAFDRGGPGAPASSRNPPPPDFQFPQMENPQLAAPGWQPPTGRLRLRLVHERDRLLADRRDAAQPPGEAADAGRVGALGADGAPRRRPGGQHLQLADACRP